MKLTRNRLVAGLIVAAGIIASVATGTIINASVKPGVFSGTDCSGNAIVACGFSDVAKLRSTYNSNSELQALYSHYGWTSAHINGTNGTKMVMGTIYRNGNVVVDGKIVATNAQSVGRWQDNGTGCKATKSFKIGTKTYWEASTSCRYGYEGEAAYVMLDKDGNFIGAINKACGNPAPATPVAPKPKPVYECNYITANVISRTERHFNVSTTAKNGATNKDYVYNFGDGTSATVGAGGVKHTYAKPGTYTATVTPRFIVNNQVVTAPTNPKCSITVTIAPEPVVQTATCDKLTAQGVTNTERNTLEFNFTTKTTVTGGATVKSYVYNFGDGTTATAGATTSHTYKNAGTYTATVTVNFTVNGKATSETCKTTLTATKNVPKPPVVECSSLKLNTIKRDTFTLSATATASAGVPYVQTAGTISGYTFTVKDDKGATVKTLNVTPGTPATSATTGQFTLQPGAYTANVVVHSNAGDKGGNGNCATTINVEKPAPEKVDACNTTTYKIESVEKGKENTPPYTTDFKQCQTIKVCDTTVEPPVIRDIYPNQMKDGYKAADSTECQPKTPMCEVPGKENLPADSKDCVETPKMCEVPGKENLPANSTDCVETPVTPETPETPVATELPKTGVSDIFTGVLGLGSIAGATWYYLASRRNG